MVLLLGSFPEERQVALTAVKDLLRTSDYLPLVCPLQTDWTANDLKTMFTLASAFCCVLFDLTNVPHLSHPLEHSSLKGKPLSNRSWNKPIRTRQIGPPSLCPNGYFH